MKSQYTPDRAVNANQNNPVEVLCFRLSLSRDEFQVYVSFCLIRFVETASSSSKLLFDIAIPLKFVEYFQ
jgi:hypothetical protein